MWSTNEDYWHDGDEFATREHAIADARAELEGEAFYVGLRRDGEELLSDLVGRAFCGSRAAEALGEAAYDMVGEAADGWPDHTPEEETALGARIREVAIAWLHEVGAPSFFAVHSIERIPADGES